MQASTAPSSTVFISHTSADKPFARMLDASFLAKGLETFLDERSIVVGDAIPAKIYEGLDRATHIAYIISCAALKSKWMAEEINVALMKAQESPPIRILPIVIETVVLPANIRHLKFADFREWAVPEKYRMAFLQLLAGMNIDPATADSTELLWYANNQTAIRSIAGAIKDAASELFGALSADQASFRDFLQNRPYYSTVKDILEDVRIRVQLESLVAKLATNSSAQASPRLRTVEQQARALVTFVDEKFSARTSYNDTLAVNGLRAKLSSLSAVLEDIRAEIEVVALSSVSDYSHRCALSDREDP